MLRALGAAIAKDLRLLGRDRAGLVFLSLAPVLVITVAGFSLAGLFGAAPGGTSAYVLPVADEDGGRLGRTLQSGLAAEPAIEVHAVADRNAARALVRRGVAGAALVIPPGASAALLAGQPVSLLLYTDPVKYLEVANVRALVQEARHRVEASARTRARHRLVEARHDARAARRRFERSARALRQAVDGLAARLAAAHTDMERRLSALRTETDTALRGAAARRAAAARARLAAELAPLHQFLDDLTARQRAFADWLTEARARAGRFADRLPPPPAPPSVPPAVAALAATDTKTLAERLLPAEDTALEVPHVTLPPPPSLPALDFPASPELPAARLPGSLDVVEASVTGAPARLNAFDQNVPGFSVTFLLLGMLLGVSLGLLDERDWGTLARLRAMPAPFAATLVAKLLARFLVGLVQMIALFAVGRLVFGVSLGPEPWALLLPTAGIVFAATAFGLVVAGMARSRDAVLPVGSIAIVTMAAAGGCWWPLELEPAWMRQAALALPTTWAMRAYNDLMIRREYLAAAFEPTAVLLAYGAAYLLLGLVLFRRHTLGHV